MRCLCCEQYQQIPAIHKLFCSSLHEFFGFIHSTFLVYHAHILCTHIRHSFALHTTLLFTINSVCRNVWPKVSRLLHLVFCAVVLLTRSRMAEPQSEIDSYCSESYDVDEIGDHQGFCPEQEALTHEHHPDHLHHLEPT